MTDQITFKGTPAERALAEQIHEVLRLQGMFYPVDAPVRQLLGNLVSYFAQRRGESPDKTRSDVAAAINANPEIFTQEVQDEDVMIITGRRGAYVQPKVDRSHSLVTRFYEPVNPLPVDDISVVITTTRPVLPKIDPVFVSDYWLNGGVSSESEGNFDTIIIPADDLPYVPNADGDSPLIGQTPRRRSNQMRINLPQGISIDLAQSTDYIMALSGDAIVSALRTALEKDPYERFAVFANMVAAKQDVRSFGKNEIRSITDYIENEVGAPVEDKDILVHVMRVSARSVDFEQQLFALNYRLHKDLEFVGVSGVSMWATRKLLDKMSANRRFKASDMGALFSYLEEGLDDSVAVDSVEQIQSRGSVSHTLSFFEWDYGVLPFNRALAAILPAPIVSRQNTAVIRVEVPQIPGFHFDISVRFPMSGRGGWLQGFDSFFQDQEILAPGATITLKRTNAANVIQLSYNEADQRIESLLYVDDSKKKSKFAFREYSFACDVEEELLTTQAAIGRIRRIKFLELAERRNIVSLVERIFEAFGEEVGTRQAPAYQLGFEQLYLVASAYRSVSRDFLRDTLTTHPNCQLVNHTAGLWSCRIDPNTEARRDDAQFDDEDE